MLVRRWIQERRAANRDAERHALLRRSWPFEDCSRRELVRAAALATPVTIPAGRTLVREGDPARELVVVVDGRVDLEAGGIPLGPLPAHGCIGTGALVDGGRSEATAIAGSTLTVLVLSRAEYRQLVEHVPTAGRKLLGAVAAELRGSGRLDAPREVEARDALRLEHGDVASVVVDRQPEVEADADERVHRIPLGVG
jgi:CRP-like cAMP-binding protein